MGKRIIVVKQGGIGDVLLATPVLRALKTRMPDSHLTLLVLPNAVDLVQGLPFIDELFPYDRKRQSIWKLIKKMRGHDIALFLDLTYRPVLAAAVARVPGRVGIAHKRGKWLTKSLPWREAMDHTYEPYVFGEIVRDGLGIDIPHEELATIYAAEATDAERQDLAAKLAAHSLTLGTRYLACSPKTAFFLKDWPFDRWNALFRRLSAEHGLRTVSA